MKVRDLNIATRLGAGFGIVLLLMVALIATALLHLREVGTLNEKMIQEDWAKANAANVINATVRANARRTMEIFLVNDKAARDAVREKIEGNKKTINEALGLLDQLVRSADGKKLVTVVKDERARYVASFTKVSAYVEEGRRDEAHQLLLEETLPLLDKLQESVKSLNDFQTRLVQDSGALVQADIKSAGATMLALGVVAVATGLAFSIWLTISITRPLQSAVRIAETVASGDLTSRIEVSSRDETGQLLQALERMNGNLIGMVSEVKTGTETIATASVQISAGNLDLSSRTEEQASSLQQTASSMEQLTSAVRQNAEHAKQANMLALNASQVATAGNQAIDDVVSTMSAINSSAARIADITGLIDGIAFQTNILALNASVEAARAGEHGRGFAVVAGEVRTLAQRAAAAAKEIKQLVEDSTERTRIGAKQVQQAGDTMMDIVASVRRVTEIMSDIAQASEEQSAGIEQVNIAIGQMDEVTQQNAALVEQAAAAAGALEDQASSLSQFVRRFKIEQQQLALAA